MTDLIEEYTKSGLISDPVKYFRRCDICEVKFHPDDLITVDIEHYNGQHNNIEICNRCNEE